ncbi:MAG TPA: BTAD domain-containing putative transcriptional regulator [Micromonosporaceae bacterium]|nr:BTAD domain-containing putative transcriptional regulator [Micromonosporaceae bacterium]
MAGEQRVSFGLLGPFTASIEGNPVAVTAGRQRAVLCALLVRAGAVVSFDELAETVWDATPPPGARAALRNYVKQLRQLLGAAGRRLVTCYPGYRIDIRTDELDVLAFIAGYDEAGTAVRAHDWVHALNVLDKALALWRGPALVDIACSALHRTEVPRLERLRLQAVEWRVDAQLRLGRHDHLVSELYALVEEHPLHERFHAQLMLALARGGHRAEALNAYRTARRIVSRELGIEPGSHLQTLHQRILSGAEDLPPSDPGPVVAVPRQLPATARHLRLRQRERDAMTAALDAEHRHVILAVEGMAGVGKTTLAVEWAYQVIDRFPDGQLYLNLRGFDSAGPPMAPAAALSVFLTALGVPDDRVPADPDARAALYRSLLANKRILVILDNAEDIDQVRPLLPGSSTCATVVTSRTRLTGLAAGYGARRLELDLLDDAEAHRLLAAHLDDEELRDDPGATAELVTLCGRLPLALTVAAARAASHRRLSIRALNAQLRDEERRLDALEAGDWGTDVRAVFSWSYHRLDAPAARMFRVLALHPGPDLDTPVAASLAGVPVVEAARTLHELTRTHLVHEHLAGRFQLHDLLRAYAAEQGRRYDAEAERKEAIGRMLEHYLRAARDAALLVDPSRPSPSLDACPPGVTCQRFSHPTQALAWMRAEREVLPLAIAAAAGAGAYEQAGRLAWEIAPLLDRRGDWQTYAQTQRIALTCATALGRPSGKARAHRHLGRALFSLGGYEDAEAHLKRALHIYEQLGVDLAIAGVQLDLVWTYRRSEDNRAALDYAQQALAAYGKAGHQPGRASALTALAWCHALRGGLSQALTCAARALCLHHMLGDRHGLALDWEILGYANQGLGCPDSALACYRRAVTLFEELEDRYNEATVLERLGDVLLARGEPTLAEEAWQRAFTILDELHHADAAKVRAKLGAEP